MKSADFSVLKEDNEGNVKIIEADHIGYKKTYQRVFFVLLGSLGYFFLYKYGWIKWFDSTYQLNYINYPKLYHYLGEIGLYFLIFFS